LAGVAHGRSNRGKVRYRAIADGYILTFYPRRNGGFIGNIRKRKIGEPAVFYAAPGRPRKRRRRR